MYACMFLTIKHEKVREKGCETIMTPISQYKARISPEWIRDGIVYEIYTRAFSREGTFTSIQRKIPVLKKLGVTILWIMPIHSIGKLKRKGKLGSPYSVYDYYSVNPELGTIEDVRSLVHTAHSHGIHIIMDLVLGHTSWNSVLMKLHPEWFKKSSNGNIISPNLQWSDVAALDYSHKGLRLYMIDMMKYWIINIGFDGFRCDDAGSVPLIFWENAREELDLIKPLLMISETDARPSHHRKAFDLTYSTKLFRVLNAILNHNASVLNLPRLMAAEKRSYPRDALLLRFSSNHDQNSLYGADTTMFGSDGAKLTAVLVNTLPGVPLLYNGQEIGSRKKLSLFDKTSNSWKRQDNYFQFYTRLFSLRKKYRALTHGQYVPIKTSNGRDVYAFARIYKNECLIMILNFSRKSITLNLNLSMPDWKDKTKVWLTDITKRRHAKCQTRINHSLEVPLPKRGWKIFRTELL
jgi:cyclomaltodextrinase / maltogenic alpha-amylase / neopullulanase